MATPPLAVASEEVKKHHSNPKLKAAFIALVYEGHMVENRLTLVSSYLGHCAESRNNSCYVYYILFAVCGDCNYIILHASTSEGSSKETRSSIKN